MANAHCSEECVAAPHGVAVRVGEAVLEMCVNVGDKEGGGDSAAAQDGDPPEDARGDDAYEGDGHKGCKGVAIDAHHVHEAFGRLHVTEARPHTQRGERHVHVHRGACARELGKVIGPLGLGVRGCEGHPLGEVTSDSNDKDEGGGNPERPVEVRVGRDELEELRPGPGQHGVYHARDDVVRVHVEERLVVGQLPHIGRTRCTVTSTICGGRTRCVPRVGLWPGVGGQERCVRRIPKPPCARRWSHAS
mmetsp:Transcript_30144/g.80987  ORF Transcript_30144/g.80987 Transcript_30144/m.80987 type:complete len:248 (-) Transcript_30144:257-1000(-)